MDQLRKQALQVAKEIVVKFVETGRISPGNFSEHFADIYNEVLRTISDGAEGGEPAPRQPNAKPAARPAAQSEGGE